MRNFYLFIYLLYIPLIPLPRSRHAVMPRKGTRRKERRKNGSRQRATPSTPTQPLDACMGEEEKNGKQKEEQKKQEARPQPSYLDNLVASYDPHGSYSEPILKLKGTISLGGQEKRNDKKTQKSRSEEKVVGFSSAPLFPARKREVVTQGGTI